MIKFFISSKCYMHEYQQNDIQNKATKQRPHQNIEDRMIAVS